MAKGGLGKPKIRLAKNESNGFAIAVQCVGNFINTRAPMWLFRCNCGAEFYSDCGHFRGQKVSCQSCGRKRIWQMREKAAGGESKKTKLHKAWEGMRSRCYTKSSSSYRWYGAKGITVCDEWVSFLTFRTWAMENGYKDGLTLDRIDSSKNYHPDNCRWVERSVNCKLAMDGMWKKRKQADLKRSLMAELSMATA